MDSKAWWDGMGKGWLFDGQEESWRGPYKRGPFVAKNRVRMARVGYVSSIGKVS